MIHSLIEFLDSLSLEDKVYWRVKTQDRGPELEVRWQDRKNGKNWDYRIIGAGNWHHSDSKNLLKQLLHYKIDMEDFKKQVSRSVLNQAVYAKLFVEGAAKIFGKDTIEKAVQETKSYLEAITKSIGDLRNKKNKSLNITPPEPESHLHVVKDENPQV